MICPVCKNTLEDSVLVCPHCEAKAAKILQTQKMDEMKKEDRAAIHKLFKSGGFITLSVIVTLMTLVYIASILLTLVSADVTLWQVIGVVNSVGFSIPFIITTVACWKTVAHKGSLLKIGGIKAFAGFFKFLYKFLFIFLIPLGSILLFGMLLLVFDPFMFSDSSFGVYTVMAQGANIGVQYNFGLIIFLISLPLFVLILILLKKSNTLYRRICGFYEKLIVCEKVGDLKTDCYYKNAAFYVFAAFWSILAILLMISVNLSLGLAFLFNAFYLVFFTLFYTHVKNIETQRQALFDEERNKLVEIERKTNQLFAEIKRKKRQEEMEQQRIEEEREREKEEIRTKLRQQKMMKELMKEIMEEEKKN